jgi:hypothetical protein
MYEKDATALYKLYVECRKARQYPNLQGCEVYVPSGKKHLRVALARAWEGLRRVFMGNHWEFVENYGPKLIKGCRLLIEVHKGDCFL